MRKFVICYDIADDKRRRLVAELLKDHGVRQQYSVFECNLDDKQYLQLKFNLKRLINMSEDSLIFYSLCQKCEAKVLAVGRYKGVIEEGENYIL